jgi:hypothetical protein
MLRGNIPEKPIWAPLILDKDAEYFHSIGAEPLFYNWPKDINDEPLEGGLCLPCAPSAPFNEMYIDERMDRQQFLEGFGRRDKDIMIKLDEIHEENIETYKRLAQSKYECFGDTGDVGLTFLNYQDYKEYITKPMKVYCSIFGLEKHKFAHAIGYPIIQFTKLLKESWIDIVMGHKDYGDVEYILKDWYEKGPILMGGVDTDMLYRATSNEVQEKVKDFLTHVSRHAKFILSTSSAVLEGTPIENLKAIGGLVQ